MAVLLTFLTVGLGQVYAGRWKRGLSFWALAAIVPLCLLVPLAELALPRWSARWTLLAAVLLLLSLVGYVVRDAIGVTRAAAAAEPRWFNRWYVYAAVVIATNLIANAETTWVRRNVVQAFWLRSGSMQPTLLIGDHIFVDKRAYAGGKIPQRGDVVVFVSPVDHATVLVERAVAVGGDKVEIRATKLYLNDELVDEPYVRFVEAGASTAPRDYGPLVVPDGEFLALGDNRDRSYDSRFWGTVNAANVLGRVSRIYWSSDAGTPRWERIGAPVK